MRTRRAADLAEALGRWENLEECLLVDLRFLRGVYSARLVFDDIWESPGKVRKDLDRVLRPVEIVLHGIEAMELVGGLSDGQRQQPEEIGWGITEVAIVKVMEGPQGTLRVDLLWPGDRRLTFVANEAEVLEPSA